MVELAKRFKEQVRNLFKFFLYFTKVENWLRRIIQERIDLEEAAFAGLKHDLAKNNGD
jgi:hypothetical protein